MAKQKSKSWFSMKSLAGGAAEIAIYSDIGDWGVTAQDFRNSLIGLGSPKELHIHISSNGGEVHQGFAIFNVLNRHAARKIVTIDGLAASMASVIAMAGDEVVMPSNSMLMIHNPWGGVQGGADEVISFGEALSKMRDKIADAYVARSGAKRSEIIAMMDRETWLSAEEAVALGLADRVEEPIQMAASIDISKFNKVPVSFGRNMEALMSKTARNAARNAKNADDEETESEVVGQKSEAEIRQEILATHAEIRSLCGIAGKPELAEGFIAEDKKPSEVLAALDKLREESAKTKKGKDGKEISARNNAANREGDGGGGGKSIDLLAAYAKFNSAGKKS